MGTTPTFSLPYPEATDPADVPTDMQELALTVDTRLGEVASVTAPPVVSALPGTPIDGQAVYLRAAPTVLWHLRYSEADARWEYLGGPPLHASPIQAEQPIPNSAGYIDLTTPGPDLTLPRAGLYTFRFGCRCRNDAAPGAGRVTFIALQIAGAAPDDGLAATWSFNTGVNGSPGARETVQAVPSASALVRMQYKAGTATPSAASHAAQRWLTATPVYLT